MKKRTPFGWMIIAGAFFSNNCNLNMVTWRCNNIMIIISGVCLYFLAIVGMLSLENAASGN